MEEFYKYVGWVVVGVVVLLAKEIITAYGQKLGKGMSEPSRSQCATHPAVMAQLDHGRRYMLWTGRLLYRICDKLEINDIPSEPQEREHP